MRHSAIGILVALSALAIATLRAAAGDAETCADAKAGDAGAAVLDACSRLIDIEGLSAEERARAHVNRAAQHQLWNNNERALGDYDEAIRLDPGNTDAFFERGTMYWVYKRDYDRAVADFNELIRLAPQDARGYMGRATVYSLKNDLDRALADYDTAIGIDPADVPMFSLRAHVHERKGDLNAALADYRHASAMSPRDRDEEDAVKQAAGDVRRIEQKLAGIAPAAPTPRSRRPTPTPPVLPNVSVDMSDRAFARGVAKLQPPPSCLARASSSQALFRGRNWPWRMCGAVRTSARRMTMMAQSTTTTQH